jgi:serine/threonine-protein kinase
MAATSTPRPGRLPVLAKYEVIEEIGHGGMATVYRAHDKRLGRDVAVKVLHPHLRDSSEVAHRFSVEAKAVAKLRHANIVEVFDVSAEDEPEQYLVVELLRGLTLRKIVHKHGALPPEVAASLAIQLLAALAHAHGAGVIHRDVKPENVIVEHRPGGPQSDAKAAPGDRVVVKLTDFGIAKLLDAQGVTSTGQVLGSPAHMAPEQIEGGEVDARADVFGLGVLLYECMVGHLPFEGNNPAQVLRRVLDGTYAPAERDKPTVGKTWSTILDRALARNAQERFVDAAAMRDALEAELKRLGFVSPRAELEAYLDDPEGYVREHEKKMIERLCDLGSEARRRGDALAAAADYNRALAYAPADPALLRIVSSMHRAEARMRAAKRYGPLVLVTVAVGVTGFYGARAIRAHGATELTARPSAVTSTTPSASAEEEVAAAVRTPMSASSVVKSATPPAVVATGIKSVSVMATPLRRNVKLVTNLQNGVFVALDGEPSGPASDGLTLQDDKQHTIELTCKDDMCEPLVKTIPAGTKDVVLEGLALKLRDARIVVEGDGTKHYGLSERGLDLPARASIPVKMSLSKDFFTVVERETGRSKRVTLTAGQETRVKMEPD